MKIATYSFYLLSFVFIYYNSIDLCAQTVANECNNNESGGLWDTPDTLVCEATVFVLPNLTGVMDLPNTELVLTNPQQQIPIDPNNANSEMEAAIVGVLPMGTTTIDPDNWQINCGEKLCVTAFSYQVSVMQDLIDAINPNDDPSCCTAITTCCSAISNYQNNPPNDCSDFCSDADLCQSSDILGLSETLTVLNLLEGANGLQQAFQTINGINNQLGTSCFPNAFFCAATSNTICYEVICAVPACCPSMYTGPTTGTETQCTDSRQPPTVPSDATLLNATDRPNDGEVTWNRNPNSLPFAPFNQEPRTTIYAASITCPYDGTTVLNRAYTHTVVVHPLPDATFRYYTYGDRIQFLPFWEDPNASYSWTFFDDPSATNTAIPSDNSTQQYPTQLLSSGINRACLTLTTRCGTQQICQTLELPSTHQAAYCSAETEGVIFDTHNPTICVGDTIVLPDLLGNNSLPNSQIIITNPQTQVPISSSNANPTEPAIVGVLPVGATTFQAEDYTIACGEQICATAFAYDLAVVQDLIDAINPSADLCCNTAINCCSSISSCCTAIGFYQNNPNYWSCNDICINENICDGSDVMGLEETLTVLEVLNSAQGLQQAFQTIEDINTQLYPFCFPNEQLCVTASQTICYDIICQQAECCPSVYHGTTTGSEMQCTDMRQPPTVPSNATLLNATNRPNDGEVIWNRNPNGLPNESINQESTTTTYTASINCPYDPTALLSNVYTHTVTVYPVSDASFSYHSYGDSVYLLPMTEDVQAAYFWEFFNSQNHNLIATSTATYPVYAVQQEVDSACLTLTTLCGTHQVCQAVFAPTQDQTNACDDGENGGNWAMSGNNIICLNEQAGTLLPNFQDISGFPNTQIIVTNPQQQVPIDEDNPNGATEPAIVQVLSNTVLQPLDFGFEAGEQVCVTGFSYDLEAIQNLVDELSDPIFPSCCTSNVFSFTGGECDPYCTDHNICAGSDVQGLTEGLLVFDALQYAKGLQSTIHTINELNEALESIPSDHCANLELCVATTPTICYELMNVANPDATFDYYTYGNTIQFAPIWEDPMEQYNWTFLNDNDTLESSTHPYPTYNSNTGINRACLLLTTNCGSNLFCQSITQATQETTDVCADEENGGLWTMDQPTLCSGQTVHLPPLQYTGNLPNKQVLLTDPQQPIPIDPNIGNGATEPAIIGVLPVAATDFQPSDYGVDCGEQVCLTSFSYNLEVIQDLVDAINPSNDPCCSTNIGCCTSITNCCSVISNYHNHSTGFYCHDICTVDHICRASDVNGLTETLTVLDFLKEANGIQQTINTINEVNQALGTTCFPNEPLCAATSNTVCFTISCNIANCCHALFTYNESNNCPEQSITFTNAATNSSVYEWHINDQLAATTTDFTHTFTESGRPIVSLWAIDPSTNCQSVYSDTIDIYPLATDLQIRLSGEDAGGFCQANASSTILDAGWGYANYIWTHNGNFIGNTQTITANQSGTYKVNVVHECDALPLTAQDSVVLITDGDCVWPGDFNENGAVNMDDLLAWGLVPNQTTGATRPYTSNSSNDPFDWIAQACLPWNNTDAMGVNGKHFDGDGNGVKENKDVNAVIENFQETHTISKSVWKKNKKNALKIMPIPGNVNSPTRFLPLEIDVDTKNGTPIAAIHGLHFDAQYTRFIGSLGQVIGVEVKFETSWLGTSEVDMVGRHKNMTSSNNKYYNNFNKLHVGLTRNDQQDVYGRGEVCIVGCILDIDLISVYQERPNLNKQIIGNPEDYFELVFDITHARAITADGTALPIEGTSDTVWVLPAPRVQAKICLEGAYDAINQQMTTSLNTQQSLSTQQPFHTDPWYYSNSEQFTRDQLPADIVDWVLVELRDADHPNTILAQKPALVQADGTLIDATFLNTGKVIPSVSLGNEHTPPNNAYYLAIKHRNHIGVMSKEPIVFPNELAYDFTNPDQVLGGVEQLKDLGNGVYGLVAGDFTGDGIINVADFNAYQAALQQDANDSYATCDANMDGVLTIDDFNQYKANASRIGIAPVRP